MKYLRACLVASVPPLVIGWGLCRAAARADAAMAQQTLVIYAVREGHAPPGRTGRGG